MAGNGDTPPGLKPRGFLPCFVVIDFLVDPARVVTAFGIRRIPRGWQRL